MKEDENKKRRPTLAEYEEAKIELGALSPIAACFGCGYPVLEGHRCRFCSKEDLR